ncbi:RHS repeat domain-containing protein [Psychrobacter pygoscelis]|uniref:RHS repeat domain-containing protein n=1 Tax=Psychrobacter pygoscelis TaxID=2488563 RepID=UPI00103CFBDE|nr:RHS repeat-associated core domain-containing protein [Psychrobacter pygoscelis]
MQDISIGYAYDANSNRTQSKITKDSAVDVNNISYEAGSNRIKGVSYDASGRILNDGSRTYTYNPAGRIERIQNGAVGVFNVYNPIGQRIQKNSGNAKTYFSYDEQGLLIGEYGVNGAAIREYVYLGGQPIAMMTSEQPNEILQIHSDHLGTPRAVTDQDSAVLWRWEGDAFGTNSPSIATIEMPLRMAGQYADDETGLFYNYYRFYDPKTGRYVTSDPIGLGGGMNTYGYVGGNALGLVDPYGLYWAPSERGGYSRSSLPLPPSIPQDSYEVLVGYGDALLLGFGDDIRNLINMDAGVDYCSSNYKGGNYTGIAVTALTGPAARLSYVNQARNIPNITNSGEVASALRNTYKYNHRKPLNWLFKDKHVTSYKDLVNQGFSNADIVAKSSRTNKMWTAGLVSIGPAIGLGRASQSYISDNEKCGCQ